MWAFRAPVARRTVPYRTIRRERDSDGGSDSVRGSGSGGGGGSDSARSSVAARSERCRAPPRVLQPPRHGRDGDLGPGAARRRPGVSVAGDDALDSRP
jgi:hypothetical protein